MGREDWVKSDQVCKAVEALKKYTTVAEAKRKRKLISDDGYIYLIANFKKIQQSRSTPKRIPLPHPIINPTDVSICLLSKDPKPKVKALLQANNIDFVNKIVSLKKLRSEYKTHERRRLLASMYDVFIADHRILPILYNKLGKAFLGEKGFPYLVNITKKDLKAELLSAVCSTHYRQNESKSISLRIGRLSMSTDEVLENITAVLQGIIQRTPKGWQNVHSIHVKTLDSTALPILNSLTIQPTKITKV